MSRKLNLIIIDDEPLARFAFRKTIEESFSSFQVSGEAGTGPEGLTLFREKSPDIVIMDINIPDLNGLETSRLILQESPSAQIIILSAYDSFDYAQNAINSGILGYLLKPVQTNNLHKLLNKAASNIYFFESQTREKKEYHTFRSMAVKDMVSSFIYGKKEGIPANTYASLISPIVLGGGFLLFRLENYTHLEETEIGKINNYLDHLTDCYPGYWQESLLPVFVIKGNLQPGEHDFSWEDKSKILAFEILRRLQVITGKRFKVGGGSLQNSPDQFSLSFRQAFDALRNSKNLEILLYSEDYAVSNIATNYPAEAERKIIQAFLRSDWDQVRKESREFCNWLLNPNQSLIDNRFGIMELLIQIRRQKEYSGNHQLANLINTMLRETELPEDKSSQNELFKKVTEELIQFLDQPEVIEEIYFKRILKYIDLNDFNEISLENTAAIVGLTPQYLSKIFKARFKVNFLEYVIRRRVEAACQLLTTTPLRIQEIAACSGYKDTSYFRKVFRKETGYTPREYRYRSK